MNVILGLIDCSVEHIYNFFQSNPKCKECQDSIFYISYAYACDVERFKIKRAEMVYFYYSGPAFCRGIDFWEEDDIVGIKYQNNFLCYTCHKKINN